jgi:carotenoid cleavage dioxygenase-like enzyme
MPSATEVTEGLGNAVALCATVFRNGPGQFAMGDDEYGEQCIMEQHLLQAEICNSAGCSTRAIQTIACCCAGHPYDGDGLVASFSFQGGRVFYRSRFITTPE